MSKIEEKKNYLLFLLNKTKKLFGQLNMLNVCPKLKRKKKEYFRKQITWESSPLNSGSG